MSVASKEEYEFADFRLEVTERLLLRKGDPVRLPEKAFETLCVLVRQNGHLVGKDELLAEVWPDTIVEENNLDKNISLLRQVLGGQRKGKESFIETVRGHGYRFLAEVRRVEAELESNGADAAFLTKLPKVEADFPTAAKHYEMQRSGNVLTVAKWQHQEAENLAESDVDETEEKRGDAEIQQEREVDRIDLSKFLNAVKQNKTVTIFILAAFAVIVIAGIVWSRWFNSQGQPIDAAVASPINSIAILPFENVAQDVNAEYLSDGITESLINDLSQIQNLKVMSRNSVFRYKGKEQDASKVGGELDVQAVLTGSVKQIGDQIVIAVRLDDARNNQHIWGEQYVRKFTDILNVQSEITHAVSTSLRLKLTGADEQKLSKNYTENVEAYQLYLKGQYEWNKHTLEDLQKSIEFYNQALEKDPNYALAYAGLSGSYGVLGNNYLPPNEALPKAKAYAAKALEIDDTLTEAHVAMGAIRLFYDWNWAEAEKELKRAQALDPNNAAAHHIYGDSLEIMGRFDEAKAERKRALELDPLSAMQSMVAGATFYFASQYDEAIAQNQKTTDLETHFYPAYFWLGQAYEQKKMYAEAIATYQKGITQAERHPQLIAALGHAYALAGERGKATQALDELRRMSKQRHIDPYLIAFVYTGLGDKEQAFAWLNRAYQDRSSFLIWLKVEPQFNSLRDDPRFQDLLRRVGLPQ